MMLITGISVGRLGASIAPYVSPLSDTYLIDVDHRSINGLVDQSSIDQGPHRSINDLIDGRWSIDADHIDQPIDGYPWASACSFKRYRTFWYGTSVSAVFAYSASPK